MNIYTLPSRRALATLVRARAHTHTHHRFTLCQPYRYSHCARAARSRMSFVPVLPLALVGRNALTRLPRRLHHQPHSAPRHQACGAARNRARVALCALHGEARTGTPKRTGALGVVVTVCVWCTRQRRGSDGSAEPGVNGGIKHIWWEIKF